MAFALKRPRIGRPAPGTLERTARDAGALNDELCPVPIFDDDREGKLNAPSYYAKSKDNAGRDDNWLEGLYLRLQPLPPEERTWIDPFRAGVRKVVRAVRVDQGCALWPPVANLHMLIGESGAPAHELINLVMELAPLGARPIDIVALEVWLATKECPEVFGRIDAGADYEQQQKALRERYAAACREVYEAAKREGAIELCPEMWFHWRGERTPVSAWPPEGAGERLIEWIAACERK